MTGRVKSRLRALEETVRRLRPATAPGVLTSTTGRGVTRRAITDRSANRTTNILIPRWG